MMGFVLWGAGRREFEWPASADGVCVFYAVTRRCDSWSRIGAASPGFGCCLRGGHSGVHLHGTGYAWEESGDPPIEVELRAVRP